MNIQRLLGVGVVFLLLFLHPVLAQENINDSLSPITVGNASLVSELGVLEGHDGAINTIVFSPDGTLLASGGEDTMVHLWDTTTTEEVVALAGHTQSITAVQFNTDGTLLASTGKDYNTFIWDVATHQNTQNVGFTEEGAGFVTAFFPEATFHTLFWLDDSVITLGDGGLSNITGSYNVNNPSFFAAARASTGMIALGGNQGIRLVRDNVNATFEGIVIEGFTSTALSLAFAADAAQLAVGDIDDTIQVWDISDVENIVNRAMLTGHTDDVTGVAFSSDGNLLVSSSLDGTIRLWDISSQTQLAVLLDSDESAIHSIALSPSGTLIASAGNDGVVRLWGVTNGDNPPDEGEEAGDASSVSFGELNTEMGTVFLSNIEMPTEWPKDCVSSTPGCMRAVSGFKLIVVYFTAVDENGQRRELFDGTSDEWCNLDLGGVYLEAEDSTLSSPEWVGCVPMYLVFGVPEKTQEVILHWTDNPNTVLTLVED